jgi:hypothetical protein
MFRYLDKVGCDVLDEQLQERLPLLVAINNLPGYGGENT